MHTLKSVLLAFSLLTLITACGGGNDSEVSSGSGTGGAANSSQKICTGDDLKGTWRITATVGTLSESDVVEFDGSESPGDNVFDITRDGITLRGTIDPSCNSISGTATDGTLSGTFTAVKIG